MIILVTILCLLLIGCNIFYSDDKEEDKNKS
jgi:hypothetical protein